MATIDKLDLSVYNLYAVRTRMIEQINRQFKISDAGAIPAQTQVLDFVPRITELDLLLGIVPIGTPWAYFYPPKRFRNIRRSPFAFHRVAPAFGSVEEQLEDEETLAEVETATAEEEEEKAALLRCLDQLTTINDWLGFVIGRVGQFLQG